MYYPITTHRFTAQLPLAEFISRFRHEDYFRSLCAQCSCYGKSYGCPPYDFDVMERMSAYTTANIIGVQIVPEQKELPLSVARDVMRPVINDLTDELLQEEQRTKGLAFGFAGGCTLCGDVPCARLTNEPCRYPHKVRPSLESYGFDLTAAAQELFGLPILWGRNQLMPDYLMLICVIFR